MSPHYGYRARNRPLACATGTPGLDYAQLINDSARLINEEERFLLGCEGLPQPEPAETDAPDCTELVNVGADPARRPVIPRALSSDPAPPYASRSGR